MQLTYRQHPDPLDFNDKCDGSLPLEDMIQPDPSIRKLFQDIDRSKAHIWALTNAYKTVRLRMSEGDPTPGISYNFSACFARPEDIKRR